MVAICFSTTRSHLLALGISLFTFVWVADGAETAKESNARSGQKKSPVVKTPARIATLTPSVSVKGSHKTTGSFKVQGDKGRGGLLTLCLDADDNIVALVGPARYSPTGAKQPSNGEVQILDPAGKVLRSWMIDFKPQTVGRGAGSDILVAGDGKIAKFTGEGKLLAQSELPFVEEVLKDSTTLRKQAEERRESQLKMFDQQLTNLERQRTQMKERLNKDDPSSSRATASLDMMIQSYETSKKSIQKQTVENFMEQIVNRLRTINSVCASDKDVFVACGEVKGYGYSVWRMDHDFKNPKMVLTALGGCCGQMDVQCNGDKLVVAENTRHRVALYDRAGKSLTSFGKRDRASGGEGFGGCCNPMNTRPAANGDVYTAESEGIVKRFSAKGEFLGTVGSVTLTGGCKNVAVAVSRDGKRVYFCDLPGSRVVALTADKDETAQKN